MTLPFWALMYVLLMDVKHPWNAGTTQVYIKQANLSTEKKINNTCKTKFFGKLQKHFSVQEFKKPKFWQFLEKLSNLTLIYIIHISNLFMLIF